MAFDRSKFKAAKLDVLKDTINEAKKKSGYGESKFPGFHSIEEGSNTIRIAPPHEEDSPSLQAFRSTYLKCDVPELGDDKKPTGKIVEKNKRIFIATVHSELEIEDPIELYIQKVFDKVYDQTSDKDERSKLLTPITGAMINGKWNPGIRPQTSFVAYAWVDGKLGRIELNNQIVKRMNELNVDEDNDQPIETDVFSDPNEGVSLIVNYDRSAKSGEKYKVSKKDFDLTKFMKKAGNNQEEALKLWTEARESEKVTDEQLKELSEQKTLKEIYVDAYKKGDFDLAVNGLQKFDENNGFGIFEDEDFIAKLEEIGSQIPEKQDPATADIDKIFKDKPGAVIKRESKELESDDSVDFSSWSIPKLKKYITPYILENYGEDYALPKLDKAGYIEWAILVQNEDELPFSEEESDGELPPGDIGGEEEAEEAEENTSEIPNDIKAKIEALRKKAGK